MEAKCEYCGESGYKNWNEFYLCRSVEHGHGPVSEEKYFKLYQCRNCQMLTSAAGTKSNAPPS